MFLQHNTNKKSFSLLMKNGFNFPLSSSRGILMTGVDKINNKIELLKDRALEYIIEKKYVSTTEIMDEFDLNPFEAKALLNILIKNGKIKVD
jgi:hypothetical protein